MLSNYFRGKKYFLRVLATIMGVVMLSGIIPNSCFVQATDDSLSSDSLWEKAIRENYTSFNIDFNSTEGNPDKAGGHVQGICVDDKMEYIYFSSSNALIKMDMKTQEIVADIQFGTLGFTEMYGLHLGCVDYYDGFIYGSLIAAKPYGKAYIVVIEADKMTERNMNGLTMQKDDGLSVVLLQDVVDDLRATMNYSEKNLDSEGGTSHYNENNGHLFGCSGIDGVTVGKMPGDTSEQIYLIVAENSFGGGIANGTRYDINNNRLLFYSMNELKVKMSDFKYDNCKKLDLTDDACVNVDDILHVWTGATQWGVQNLEYEWDTGDIVLYTYPNDSGFGKDMYVIDGNKVPEMKELQVGQYNTDIDSTVQAFAKESATYYKALKCYQSETLTDEGYPIVKYAVLKCICGDPAHHQYEDGDCWGDTGVLKTDYPICSSDCIHSGANLGIHWLDNDGDNIDYFYIVDNITNCVNVSLYKRVTAENGSFSISKVTGVMAQNIEGNTTEKLRNADGDGDYKKQEVDEYISTGTHPTSAENKVFAGWYLDSECTKPYNNQSDANSVYAKFIDANILSFKFQLTKDTTVASEKTNLRLITSVDSLQYKNVGFDVTINNSTKTFTSKTVYTSLKGYVNEQQTSYSPSVFSMDSKYFMAHTLENIPRSFFMETITVTPKWTTLDGTSVTGISRSFTINEILESGYNDLGWMEFEHSSDQMLIMKNDENPVHRRVAYTDVEVTPLASMGDYAFQIIGTGKTNPGGSMYSKTTYNTGAILNFMMYVETQNSNVTEKKVKLNSITSNLKKENTISLSSTEFNKWINVQIILANRTSQVDFALDFKNDGDSSIFGDETVNIYIDNIHVLQTNENDTKVNESILLSFEEEVEMLNVHEFNKSSYEWVSYTAENITPYTSEESHALKVQASESNEYYPGAIIDLGQTYSKGTQLTFMTYLKNAQSSNDDVYIETYARDSLNNGRQSNTTVMSSKKYNDWILVTVTLSKDTSFLEIFVNLSGKISDAKNVQFYVDRIQVLKSNADVNFEEVTDSFRVEGNGGTPVKRVACKDISITPQEDMGNYVLEMDGTKKTYPGVIIDLGKTLAQGTVITMKTYTAVDSSVINGRTINFECFSVDNTRASNTCTYSTNNYNEWITVTVTLKQDTKKIQLFTNLDAGQGNAAFGENTVKIYLDNVSIVDTKGDMTFENASDIQRVEGNGDTTVKRVAYKDIDIKPQSNMGDYVLEIDGTGQAWPGMFINFGETLKKGSKVTMKMYAAVDADIVCHSVKSVLKVECFTIFSNDNREGNSVALSSSKYNQWITVTVTLNHDTDRIHLFANTDCFNNGKSALGSKVLKVYLDNVHIGE